MIDPSPTRFGGRRAIALVAGALALAACGDSGSASEDEVAAIGDAYVTVLSNVLPETELVDGEPLPVLYLWEFTEEPMSLDDQVVVIESFDDTHDVRFVDQFDAAVDVDQPGTPPRDDGLLVGLGPVPADPPHSVRVELYESELMITAVSVTISYDSDAWTVTAEEPVEPEAFDVVT